MSNISCWRRGVVVSGVRRMNEVNPLRARLVPGWVTVFGRAITSRYVTSQLGQLSLTSSTSFDRGKGGNVASAGWHVTLCDPIWDVSSRSGEACCELLYSVYLYLYLRALYSP